MGKQKIADPKTKGQARDKAADLLNVNRQYIQDAKMLQAEAPDLAAKVRASARLSQLREFRRCPMLQPIQAPLEAAVIVREFSEYGVSASTRFGAGRF